MVIIILDIKKVIKDILVKLNLIADYVVEEGTSDVWTHRKWNSGIAECWMRYQGTVSAYSSSMFSGASYGYFKNWNLPFEFIELYTKTATAQVGNGTCIVASGGLNDTLKTVCLHWASNVSSGTSTVNMYIIGKYKTPTFSGGGTS